LENELLLVPSASFYAKLISKGLHHPVPEATDESGVISARYPDFVECLSDV
jgi:hypothetical protein